jgi:glycosyltransferase involved in cell wall biosynthesis
MTTISSEACVDTRPSKVICSFYASTTYGSEYRAGLEFIKFAAANAFDLAIVADLEENSSEPELEASAPGISVVRVPSPVKHQPTLYRYSDFFAQWIWHFRVARWLHKQQWDVQCLWVHNGASPWLPLTQYFGLSKILIWGPVGGGEPPTAAMMKKLRWKDRLRERLRSLVERIMLRGKIAGLLAHRAPRVVAMARTGDAQRQLSSRLGRHIPVIPEIIDPLEAVNLRRVPGASPRLIWVGQDIPRKNLSLALQLFMRLRLEAFPELTLDIFGCSPPSKALIEGVTFHGWVPSVPWQEFHNDGVLLLTSFREGLPSAVLEAARNGLLTIASDVGAIGSLGIPTIHLLPKDEYPNYTDTTIHYLKNRIRQHIAQKEVHFESVSHRNRLVDYLRTEGCI